jgi:hypothetical protein
VGLDDIASLAEGRAHIESKKDRDDAQFSIRLVDRLGSTRISSTEESDAAQIVAAWPRK